MTDQYIEKLDQVYPIKGTRVALDSVIYQFEQGRSPEAIQDTFPALSLAVLKSHSGARRVTASMIR